MRTFEVTEARLLQVYGAAFNDDIQDATDTVPEEYISHGITLIKE